MREECCWFWGTVLLNSVHLDQGKIQECLFVPCVYSFCKLKILVIKLPFSWGHLNWSWKQLIYLTEERVKQRLKEVPKPFVVEVNFLFQGMLLPLLFKDPFIFFWTFIWAMISFTVVIVLQYHTSLTLSDPGIWRAESLLKVLLTTADVLSGSLPGKTLQVFIFCYTHHFLLL